MKGYAFYLNGELLAYTSLMYANLYQDLTDREIESITLAGETDAGGVLRLRALRRRAHR